MMATAACGGAVGAAARRALATTKPVKKKLTQAMVSICGTIIPRLFFIIPVIALGSDSISCCGVSFALFCWNRPVSLCVKYVTRPRTAAGDR